MAELAAAREQARALEEKFERQMASLPEMLQVVARAELLKSQELDAANQVEIARANLAEVLGRPVNEPLAKLGEIVSPWELENLDVWVQRGLSASSALEAMRLDVEAAAAGVKQAAGRYHPTLDLTLSAQKSDIGYENTQAPTAEIYVASLNLTIPIYSGGQISAQLDEARAQLRVAEANYMGQKRAVRKAINEAFLKTQSAQQRVVASQRSVAAAEKSLEAQQKGFEYGIVASTDVLDATKVLFETKRDYRRACYDLMLEGVKLQQAAGAFEDASVAKINAWLEEPGH